MRDSLREVALINSAKFGFSKIKTDGNILLIGANGVGKTSFLRAILYFFTLDSRNLGISHKKESFSDFYFEYENSYIAYVYKKQNYYILAVAFRSSSIHFKLCLCHTLPNLQELFIKDGFAVSKEELFKRLDALGNVSKALSPSEFKRVLYLKKEKLKQYNLFEASDYEGYTKSLSNIFINSKVDSNTIKKVIISSLNASKSIDIERIKRHLSSFAQVYKDIKTYEKLLPKAKKAIALLESYEDTLNKITYNISIYNNAKSSLISSINALKNELTQNTIKRQKTKDSFEKKQKSYADKLDKIKSHLAVINNNLKQIKELKEYYKAINIEQKLTLFKSLESKELELKELIKQKEFLLKESKELESAFNLRQNEIKNYYKEQKNAINEAKVQLQIGFTSQKEKLNEQKTTKLEELTKSFRQKSEELNSKINKLTQEIHKLEYQKLEIKNKKFEFSQKEHLQELQNKLNSLKERIKDKKQKLKELDINLQNQERAFLNKEEQINSKYKEKLNSIEKKITQIKDILFPKEDSLSKRLLANNLELSKYSYFLKKEILLSEIDCKIIQNSSNIFELDFKDFSVPKESLEAELEELQEDKKSLVIEFNNTLEQNKKEFKNFENRIYREKRAINEELKSANNKVLELESKIKNLIYKKEQLQKEFKQKQEESLNEIAILIEQKEMLLEELKRQKKVLLEEEQNQKRAIKTKFTKELNSIKKEFEVARENLDIKLKDLEEKEIEALNLAKEQYHNMLQKKVDIALLKSIESQIEKLGQEIKEIQGYQKEIVKYEIDLENIKKEKSYQEAQKEKKQELNTLEQEWKKQESSYQELFNRLQKEKERLQSKLQAKELIFQEANSFENSSVFKRAKELAKDFKPKQDEKELKAIIESLNNLLLIFEQKRNELQATIASLTALFNSSLHIKEGENAISSAKNLQEYIQNDKIKYVKSELSSELNKIVKNIVDEYEIISSKGGEIESLINKINRLFESVSINVIDEIALRYSKSDNKIIEIFERIKSLNDENIAGFGISLFSLEDNSKELIKILEELIDVIEKEKIEAIALEDSFVLEFRVVENSNDSKWQSSLDNIGSNGTDVLVKSMIYIAMLFIFKSKITKKELDSFVILDEVGILSQRYLKELINFANSFGVYFINGAPDEKLVDTYKRVYLIQKRSNISIVNELVVR